ncbi:tetratricopeptide repeat protein [Ketobacter sp. MCCC 1A13808]|uniref:tetratricopeptide repeat protein n=1 Tax=Ketobacter sp. MCCC 1A13808 TaxID=2602738 RepID=UPI0012EC8C57|nr:tetratricopeptide repeat protein [Ketobacter sp. MCCC 1A13808]MVF12642.1 tetratricopeptide repeat protein [Ketobacter sp. MCCC 1A13808]
MSSTRYLRFCCGLTLALSLLTQGCSLIKPDPKPAATADSPDSVTVELTDEREQGAKRADDDAASAQQPDPVESNDQARERLQRQRVEALTMNMSSAQNSQAKQAQPDFDRAINEMRKGNLDSALQRLQAISKSYPALSGPIVNQAIILRKMGKKQEAYDLLHKALHDHGKNPFLLNELGVISRELGKFKQAQASYESAIRIDENYLSAHYNLAVLADLYLHDPALALAEFEAYQRLLPTPDKKVAGWMKEIERRAAR